MQGKLRDEALHFDVYSECACCAKPVNFRMQHDLTYTLEDPASDPVFFVPMVNFAKLRAASIIDDF